MGIGFHTINDAKNVRFCIGINFLTVDILLNCIFQVRLVDHFIRDISDEYDCLDILNSHVIIFVLSQFGLRYVKEDEVILNIIFCKTFLVLEYAFIQSKHNSI